MRFGQGAQLPQLRSMFASGHSQLGRASSKSGHVRYAERESGSLELVQAATMEAPITDRPRFGRFQVIQGGRV